MVEGDQANHKRTVHQMKKANDNSDTTKKKKSKLASDIQPPSTSNVVSNDGKPGERAGDSKEQEREHDEQQEEEQQQSVTNVNVREQLPSDLCSLIPDTYSISDITVLSSEEMDQEEQLLERVLSPTTTTLTTTATTNHHHQQHGHHRKRLKSDEDSPTYLFNIRFKRGVLNRFVEYRVKAFRFNEHYPELTQNSARESLRYIDMSELKSQNNWIIVPQLLQPSPISSSRTYGEEETPVEQLKRCSASYHFYRALVHVSQHWKKWLEDEVWRENNESLSTGDFEVEDPSKTSILSTDVNTGDINIGTRMGNLQACVAKFQRVVLPDDSAFLSHLNAVSLQHVNNSQRRRSLVFSSSTFSSGGGGSGGGQEIVSSQQDTFPSVLPLLRSRSRQKRRGSLTQEDLSAISAACASVGDKSSGSTGGSLSDEVDWSQYIVMEFRAEQMGECLFCVHDMRTCTTRSKVQRILPESALVKDTSQSFHSQLAESQNIFATTF